MRNALRHLYTDTLGRPDCVEKLPRPKREQRLPVVLSREEVQRLFAMVTNLKQKALLMVAYDAGLRLSEIINLRIEDLDSQRMVIRIRQGKGKKDRYARLTPGLLNLLREYWKAYRPKTLLFPGATPDKPYDPRHARPTPQKGMPQGGYHQAGQHAYAAAHFRHSPAGSRHQSTGDSAVAWTTRGSRRRASTRNISLEELREAPSMMEFVRSPRGQE